MTSTPLRVFLATSGWEGPFQYEQVIVCAATPAAAQHLAEEAFGAVAQPVCRAKMRLADLGPAQPGVLAGPTRAGEPLASGMETGTRCGVEFGGD